MKTKILTCLSFCCWCFGAMPDTVRLQARVLEDESGSPMRNVDVTFNFTEDVGLRKWTESNKYHKMIAQTDDAGFCRMSGESNCGEAGCYVDTPPPGYYSPERGFSYRSHGKNLFGVWQPDNLVATIRLQRVEHPIPLFVKRVKLENFEKGIFKENGPDGVLRYDMIKGDWLPPHGFGSVCDLEISSSKVITGKDRKYRNSSRRVEDVFFFDFIQKMSVSSNDCLSAVHASPFVGIRIRNGGDDGQGACIYRKTGRYKRIDKFGEWYSTHYDDFDASRCYTFRIRSRHDENGRLVEAYYGKIYGDFELQYDDRLGLTEIRFLYYVNTTPLDKNLEWDMNNNFCPSPGSLNQPLP